MAMSRTDRKSQLPRHINPRGTRTHPVLETTNNHRERAEKGSEAEIEREPEPRTL